MAPSCHPIRAGSRPSLSSVYRVRGVTPPHPLLAAELYTKPSSRTQVVVRGVSCHGNDGGGMRGAWQQGAGLFAGSEQWSEVALVMRQARSSGVEKKRGRELF
jgi:hypothetical protein